MYSTAEKIDLIKNIDDADSITKGCKIYNISRDTYHRWEKQLIQGGELAVASITTRSSTNRNSKLSKIQNELLLLTFTYPLYRKEKIAEMLNKGGFSLSTSGVRYIWDKYGVTTINDRLEALTAKYAQGDVIDQNIDKDIFDLIEGRKLKRKGFMVDSPGKLGIHYIHEIKKIPKLGQLYLQIYIDYYSNYTFAKIINSIDEYKTSDFIESHVCNYFELNGFEIKKILTPIREEFCGTKNPNGRYRLFNEYRDMLSDFSIKHIYRTDEKNFTLPIIWSLIKKIENEFLIPRLRNYRIQTLMQIHEPLEKWIKDYNEKTPFLKKYCFGKTPKQTIDDWFANQNR